MKQAKPPRPRRLLLGAYRWSITWDGKAIAEHEEHKDSGGRTLGMTDEDQQLVHVLAKQHPDQLADTLVHELLHAALHVSGLQTEQDTEEEYVRALAPYIVQLARTPAIVAWLRDPS